MLMMDKLALGRKARELGFTRDTFEKMSRLTEILRYMNTDRELKSLLALKGGTAINLTLFSLPRLSVDIDLDFTENLSRDETAEKRALISDALRRFMAAEGYEYKGKSKHTHALDSHVYAYTNAAGNSDNIKIEINYLLRAHMLPLEEVTARTGDVFPELTVQALSAIEIFASKIVALTSRAAARDLYDINNMVQNNLFNGPDIDMLRKCAVFYMAIAGEISEQGFDIIKIKGITPHKVKTDLYPMIRTTEQFDLQAVRERVCAFIDEHMMLTVQETAFLKHFTTGRYEPELLFDDDEIVKRVGNHPMALWRTRHVREGRIER